MPEHPASDNSRGHRPSNPKRKGVPISRGPQGKPNKPRHNNPGHIPRKSAILDVANEPMPDLSNGPDIAIKDMKSMTMQQLNDLAEQLGLRVTDLADYAARDQTMTDHARELAEHLNLRGPTRTDIPFMIEAAAKTAWATDKGMTIANGVVTALREARILLPSNASASRDERVPANKRPPP